MNRDKMLSVLKGPKFEQILQKARENWIEYQPTKYELLLPELIQVLTIQNFKE